MSSALVTPSRTSGPVDQALRSRAQRVIPGGMYGHLSTDLNQLPSNYPQFFARGEGARLFDVDGRSFIDFMCAWGPMLLGYGTTVAEEAAAKQTLLGDTLNGPGGVMVELAELLVDTVAHADWAMFAKNGNDATVLASRVSRAATGRAKILKASHAYHGASAEFTPILGGVTEADRANIVLFEYNDLVSVEAAVAAHDGDVAAIYVTPLQHDGFVDQEHVDPAFARGVREICDRIGAVLVLDEVRTALRIDLRGAWEPLGVRPDLTCFSKALANGIPLAAVTGVDSLRESIASIYMTGSFWYGASAMAAGVATISHMRDIDGTILLHSSGQRFRDGLAAQAKAAGVAIVQSGHPQMPFVRFEADDSSLTLAKTFSASALDGGVYLHPWHNWFLSVAHTDDIIDEALQATEAAFTAVRNATR